MKPSWNDAPEWAQYLAMDSDGAWYWYEQEPDEGFTGFTLSLPSKVESAMLLNWGSSLESRPEPELRQ